MKIEKLPSGSYRIRKMYKGKMYTVMFEGKPTQKEAVQAMARELEKVQGRQHQALNFETAAERYIESKRNVLSPSTIRGYCGIIRQLPEEFLKESVYDITAIDVQKEINRMSKNHSPKTVRNHHGFISAVLAMFCPNLKLSTTLPQKVKSEPYIPSAEDIKQILERVEGTEYEIPIILACYGMRRSEICALGAEDIEGDVVHIHKAVVEDETKNWITKSTKTTSSTREIIIPMWIAEKIKKQGYAYRGYPGNIGRRLAILQDQLGIPNFSLHKLRHYFASQMSSLGVPDADIMKLGGWETDVVMKSVYRHSMMEKEEQAKRDAAEKLKNALFSRSPS
ncbi:MAG: tyrosine-type recombinase/integrase [Lachnospiraceae bacterium]|nr:tyrosine-type recombinase/integrase [Lachnospiraceae bacterium]